MNLPEAILVTCATGNQGRGVVCRCLDAGYRVHAYVRDTRSPEAQQLAQLGAYLVGGDLNDAETLHSAAQDVDAVFHADLWTGDWRGDVERSAKVVDAARASLRVNYMFLSTAIKTGQHESFPGWGPDYPMRRYWLNKHAIEQRVRNAGFERWTIVRPGHFLQNLTMPGSAISFPGFVDDAILRVSWWPETRLPWVDAADVGLVVAAALADPERYDRAEVALAVEALTIEQLANKMSKALGTRVSVHYQSDAEVEQAVKQGSPVPASHRWANEVPGAEAAGQLSHLSPRRVDSFLAANASQIRP
ncbi:NAD dependent epimerase/dehydratase [Drechmeria coniospora]|uniref:NAD dependent epimerase/dehydratase n=1 Tax=Drechmeria coniospora TaxID=98403 RepID=A0A151GVX7_DRECN|nr:NAD dependent epimerase/dehydratase [Drechmeria coniospora]KYK61254.1 NAD dependent epimerase/dehydratase [Drechmeria coniospora]ODA81016.1 hypothetical protein RJ55_03978 [Drechmeria coniospora]